MIFTAWVDGECREIPSVDDTDDRGEDLGYAIAYPIGGGKWPDVLDIENTIDADLVTGIIIEQTEDFNTYSGECLVFTKDNKITTNLSIEFQTYENVDLETANMMREVENNWKLTPKPTKDYPYLLTTNLAYEKIFSGKIEIQWVFPAIYEMMQLMGKFSYTVGCDDWIGFIEIKRNSFSNNLEGSLIAFSDKSIHQIQHQDLFIITKHGYSDEPLFTLGKVLA